MKKTVRVTIEKEIEIDIPDHMLTPEYKADFESGLWKYEDENELFTYAARMAAGQGDGHYEGLGFLGYRLAQYIATPDVRFEILYDDLETEVLED